MANLKALNARVATVQVDLGDGDILNITYRPAAYTPAFEAATRKGIESRDPDALGKMVAQLITDWDLYEDEGQKKKVPITVEALGALPLFIIAPILEEVAGDMRPNLKSAVPSGAGSMEP